MMSKVPIAVRAFTTRERKRAAGSRKGKRPPKWPTGVLVLDTETTTDPAQRLLFGCYQYCRWTSNGTLEPVIEGLFYADDLADRRPEEFEILEAYARKHHKRLGSELNSELGLLSRREFMSRAFFSAVEEGPILIVGFNLPFDLSRIAIGWGEARGGYLGGFSFPLFSHINPKTGERLGEDRFKRRACVKPLDPRNAFMRFTKGRGGGPHTGKKNEEPRLLDLRTLAFALTSRSHSLKSACEAFDVAHPKTDADAHGVITPEYIDYCRRDVLASLELLEALRAEFDRHPLALRPFKTFSPASLAKAYLSAMGLTPPLEKFHDVAPEFHGICMQAYFGGRSEVRIRHSPVPVAYLDFLSMYPTVNCLLGLWEFEIARTLEVTWATRGVRDLLREVTLEDCFGPAFWPKLNFIAQVKPDADILPLRAQYHPASHNHTIGVNNVSSDEALWYAGPDLVTSKLLTGQTPEVVEALRLVPHGQQDGLQPVKLRGKIGVDPATGDFFKSVIELRKEIQANKDLSEVERAWTQKCLEMLANAGSYGIHAEMNPKDLPESSPEAVKVYANGQPYLHTTNSPEDPGKYCFPAFAALTTAGARLMLAMGEVSVRENGGVHAFCDTDSLAVVATEEGGRVACPGGSEELADRRDAVRALSWSEIEEIQDRFEALKPYDPEIVQGPVLEVESENFHDGNRRHLYCLAVSAKRYALFTKDEDGGLDTVVKGSQHGLGHLLPPVQLEASGRTWTDEVWAYLIRKALGEEPEERHWFDRPAVSRTTMSSPDLLKPFEQDELSYAEQVKPFNFILSVPVARGGHPEDVDPTEFSLIAPYESDPGPWMEMEWINKYSGETYTISTEFRPDPRLACVKSFRDVVAEYWSHPEPKSAGPGGLRCRRLTRGLLKRRNVRVAWIDAVGKESNKLDQVDAGLVSDCAETQETYGSDDEIWETVILPILNNIEKGQLAREIGVSEKTIQKWRNGRQEPSPTNRRTLMPVIREYLEDPSSFRKLS